MVAAESDWPALITASYASEVGETLCAPGELMKLPAVVLCHDMSPDPRFVYANRAAQRLWQRDWSAFVGMPSRLTAPPEARAERSQALGAQGVVRGYSGIRVRQDGSLFRIADATVWPVLDAERGGIQVGQAATFRHWADL